MCAGDVLTYNASSWARTTPTAFTDRLFGGNPAARDLSVIETERSGNLQSEIFRDAGNSFHRTFVRDFNSAPFHNRFT